MNNRVSEFELIAEVFAPLASAPGAFGLTDDAAVVPSCPGYDLVVTTDALVEGVHFFSGDPPASVARKALRVNLSDLAGCGAEPMGYLLALSLPARIGMTWLKDFARGLGEDQKKFALPLLGGDTISTPGPLTLAITALGLVPEGKMIRRLGAKPGDEVFVSGTIGDAGGGLALLLGDGAREEETRAHLIRRYRKPSPRLSLGVALRGIASAALDVSDGLIADLGHIADVSGVKMVIDAGRIPRSPALRALWGDADEVIVRAATAGDDYEIAFTARSGADVLRAAEHAGVAVSHIGTVEAGRGVVLLGGSGRVLDVPQAGFRHF